MNPKKGKTSFRIRGISLGPFGLSWEKVEKIDEKTLIRGLILFLEDKRILHNPATGHSVASHFVVQGLDRSTCLSPYAVKSIIRIREEIGKLLKAIPEENSATKILRHLREMCQWALNCAEKMQADVVKQDSDYEDIWSDGALEYGMTFLGLYRRKMGRYIKELAKLYDLPIEGPLQKMIEMTAKIGDIDGQVFQNADKLEQRYKSHHSGFRNMSRGWYERLCEELQKYTSH